MIFNDKGERMEREGELKPWVAKLLKKFPDFEKTGLIIEAKSNARNKVQVYAGGKTDDTAVFAGERNMPPPAKLASLRGEYVENSQKKFVYFSQVPPTRDEKGNVSYEGAEIITIKDRMLIPPDDIDKAVFLTCFSNAVEGGIREDVNSVYVFVHEEEQAEARMKQINSSLYEKEIAFEETRMGYDKIKEIMTIMLLTPTESETRDRLILLDHVKGGAEDVKKRYETAKLSALKEAPKYDLSNVTKLIKDGKKSRVLYQDKGFWMLKKSEVNSEKIIAVQGVKATEQDFAFAEYLNSNPEHFDEIKNYVS